MKTCRWFCAIILSLMLGSCVPIFAEDAPVTQVAVDTTAQAAQPPATPAVEVHAWKQARYYINTVVDDERSDTGKISEEWKQSTFEIANQLGLLGLARFPKGRVALAEVYIQPWLPNQDPGDVYIHNLYFDTPADNGAVWRLGKAWNNTFGLPAWYGNRKTSNYSPLSEAFTESPVIGLQYLSNLCNTGLSVGLLESPKPGFRFIGIAAASQFADDALFRTTVPHLSALDRNALSGPLQLSARYAGQFGPRIVAGLSGSVGSLDDTDTEFLEETFATYDGTNTRQNRWGFDAAYRWAPLYGTFEYYNGCTGGIAVRGWSVLLGYENVCNSAGPYRDFSPGYKGFYARYTQLNIGVPTTLDTDTWDTQQVALSYVLPLHTKAINGFPKWLQFEYERNTETSFPGADEIPNNQLFVELWCAF